MRQPSQSDAVVRFPGRMRLRTPQALPGAIRIAAERRCTSPAEWARQALLKALEADGVRLLPNGGIETRERQRGGHV
jgi:hypothetical protein